jgi:hypothetical protein
VVLIYHWKKTFLIVMETATIFTKTKRLSSLSSVQS